MGNLYAILYDEPTQKPIVEQVCFGSCGKIIVGQLDIPLDGGILVALACRQDACPALDKQMDEPCASLNGDPVYLRKLRDTGGQDHDPCP